MSPWLLLALGLLVMVLPATAADDDILVESVTFVGNESVKAGDLMTVMIQRPSGILGFFNDTVYNETTLEEDLTYIQQYYQQRGWREAKVLGHDVEIDAEKNEAHVTITVEEGPRTHIADLLVFGNKAFDSERVLDRFGLDVGDPLNRIKMREGSERVVRLYAESGYLQARVNPAVMVDPELNEAYIDVAVTENTQYHVGQMLMMGVNITDAHVVRRELEFETGDIMRYSSLAETQRNLYETSLFRSVFVRHEESITGDSTARDVLVDVVERDPILFTMSGGLATLEILRARMGIRNENIFGTGRAAGIEGWVSFINHGAEASFKEPWIFGIPWTGNLRLKAEFSDEPGYDYSATSVVAALSKRIFGRGSFSVSYRHTNGEYNNIDVLDFDEDTSPRIRSLNQSFSYDTRNDPFSPSHGYMFNTSNEYALQFLGSTNEFFKTRIGFRTYYPWDRKTVLATHLEVGWVDAGGGLSDIPLGERLYAGGPNSLRGFPYRSVGPKDDDDDTPLGGRAKISWNALEVRYHVWRFLGAVAFVDVGNIFERADNIDSFTLRTTPGLGVRVESPVGMLRLDVGFNPWPRPGEDRAAYHVSIGHAF